MPTNKNINEVEFLLEKAINYAKAYEHEYVTVDHLFRAMLDEKIFTDLLKTKNSNIEFVITNIADVLANLPMQNHLSSKEPIRSSILNRVFEKAVAQSVVAGRTELSLDVLLWAMLTETNAKPYIILASSGINIVAFKDELEQVINPESVLYQEIMNAVKNQSLEKAVSNNNEKRAESGKPKDKKIDVLQEFCTNITQLAKDGLIDTVIGRDVEIDKIFQVLGRKTKQNVALVGDPGVGKSVIIDGIALRIAQGNVPKVLKDYTIYSLDTANLVAGTKFRGDFEERVKMLVESLEKTPKCILFLDELHTIKGSGSTSNDGAMDFSNMLKPALAKGKIKVIGATTAEEFKKFIEKDKALTRRFYKIDIDEPSVSETIEILKGTIKHYESFHNVKYTDEAIEKAVNLSVKYIHSKKLPDKAFDIIDSAGSRKKLMRIDTNEEIALIVDDQDIENEIAMVAKIPAITLKEEQTDNFSNLKDNLKSKIFGQDHVIEKIVNYILVSKAGLRETEKPMMSALFLGSSGVGKTETSKQLAHELKAEFVRFDMSEYVEEHSISKLIGSPPGYVGFEDGTDGALINAIEKNPSCILLIDEVEKAHPKVLNILLQVMDYGMLTSSKGKKVSFRNAVIILTSNLGAEFAGKQSIGFGSENIGHDMEDSAVKEFFKPEFRNRLDAILSFNRLDNEQLKLVVDKFVAEANSLVSHKNVKIVVSEAARDFFAEEASKSHMGARPIANLITQHIKEPLSMKILFGELKNGGTVNVDYKDEKIELIYEPTIVTEEILEGTANV